MAHDVFISHSSKDKTVADTVCAVLEENGIRCWVAPRDIRPGADWGESIINALRESHVMVLIFSGYANESPQIKREVNRAVDRGIPIIPFRIENVLPTGSMEYSISTAHWLDAFTFPLEQYLDTLSNVVREMLDMTGTLSERKPAAQIPKAQAHPKQGDTERTEPIPIPRIVPRMVPRLVSRESIDSDGYRVIPHRNFGESLIRVVCFTPLVLLSTFFVFVCLRAIYLAFTGR